MKDAEKAIILNSSVSPAGQPRAIKHFIPKLVGKAPSSRSSSSQRSFFRPHATATPRSQPEFLGGQRTLGLGIMCFLSVRDPVHWLRTLSLVPDGPKMKGSLKFITRDVPTAKAAHSDTALPIPFASLPVAEVQRFTTSSPREPWRLCLSRSAGLVLTAAIICSPRKMANFAQF